MEYPLPADMGDAGVGGVVALVSYGLGWICRPQPTRDVGIDAQVETVLAGRETGRLLGLQIKAGPSWFAESAPDGAGWVFREGTLTHRDYWLDYQLPVLLVLYDPRAHVAYWQHITEQTAVVTGKGFKVVVPASQRLDVTAKPVLAALARTGPVDRFRELLDQLPARCAARLRDLEEVDPVAARSLAERMVAGRTSADTAVQQIMHSAPAQWLGRAWAAVGEFAGQYGQLRWAAECYLRTGEAQSDGQKGRWLAFAGLTLIGVDPQQARSLLERAASMPEGDLLAAVGLAVLEHGSRPDPVPIPAIVTDGGQPVEDEPTIQRFLAEQAARAGDRAGAIRHHEQALRLAPDSVGQQLALAEALLQGEARPGTASRMAGYRRAANLASAARAECRRSLLDSLAAAQLLMQALTLAGDDEAAARVATAEPDGEAIPAEAAAPQLALPSARTAFERGDIARAHRFATVVHASSDPIWITQLEAIVAKHEAAPTDELVRRWQAVVAAPVEPGQRLGALAELAQLGSWPLPELDELAAAGQLAPGMYDMLHARAFAVEGDHQRALALLRPHLADSEIVAEDYARLLNTVGRVDDCVTACDQASQRFGGTRLDLFAMDVLTEAGRVDEALARATEFLSRADLPLGLRHEVRARIFDSYLERKDWRSCERLMVAGLGEVARLDEDLAAGRVDPLTLPPAAGDDLAEYRRGYAWWLIIVQASQGDIDRALATLDAYQPEIVTARETAAWVDLQRRRGWTGQTAARALDLAGNADLPPQLIGHILFFLLQAVPVAQPGTATAAADDARRWAGLPAGFHERLNDQWEQFLHSATPLATQAPTSDNAEQRDAQLRDLLQPGTARQNLAAEAVWQGRAPLGVIATASGKPYLLALAEQQCRILPAVDPDPVTYESERQAAATAVGHDITVEPSALYLCAALLGRWEEVAAAFSDVLIAEPAADDIHHSHIAALASAKAAGYLGLDHSSGPLQAATTADQRTADIIEQTTTVHDAAQGCRGVPVDNLTVTGSADPIAAVGAYLAPLAVAAEHRAPFYSDDVYLRAAARSLGVPTFGTLALLEVLASEHTDPADPDTVLRLLFRQHVVDLFQAGALILNFLTTERMVTEAVLIGLARPATWQPFTDHAPGFIAQVLSLAYQADPDAFADVVVAAATGATAAFNDPEAVLALIATVALTYILDLTPDNAAMLMPALQAVGAQRDVDPSAKIREMLVGVLTDPDDRFRLTPSDAEHLVTSVLHPTQLR